MSRESQIIRHKPPHLTIRELEVLKLLIKGLLIKEIAYELNITKRTVTFHARSIYQKYGIKGFKGARNKLLDKFGHFEVSLVWVPTEEYNEVFIKNGVDKPTPNSADSIRSEEKVYSH